MSIRASQNDGYSRLVAEWPKDTAYTLSKEGDRVLVRFAKAGMASVEPFSKDVKNILNIDMLSNGAEPLQIAVTIPKGSRFREVPAAGKFIIDVFDPTPDSALQKNEKTASAPKPPEKETDAKKPNVVLVKDVEPAAAKDGQKTAEQKPQASVSPADETKEVETPLNAEISAPGAQDAPVKATIIAPYTISLTATTPFGVAAYHRGNALYVLTDAASAEDIEAKIDGPHDVSEKPQPLTVAGMPAFKISLPEGADVAVEGGGLAWKIAVGNENAQASSPEVPPSSGNGKVSWAMKDMRKTLTFEDPMTGEKMTAVLSSDAAQSSGAKRRFVDFETMPVSAGLVFAWKTDDLKTDVSTTGVSVGKPGGLILSPEKDMAASKIRAEIGPGDQTQAPPASQPEETGDEKPEEKTVTAEADPASEQTKDEAQKEDDAGKDDAAPAVNPDSLTKTANEKPAGNNIYNFPRWAMGGLPALEKNQHAMMVELSQKDGDARTGDLITLSKMLVANNRGAEALGILRIVQQLAPPLTENREFLAIRGAANALSGKYDEAFSDLSTESLSNFEDVKYWRAFTLAGLEDWKQAGDVLPPEISPVKDYPDPVRVPLLLSFAEIALRSGRIDAAQATLESMKAGVPKLALPYASSWNYLKGEAERQAGDLKAAEELWEPLVKNGKDDLFRAKAGLSLIKLELDTKQIKPAEAINRLEGLRYAWRGDELEALVNYRLGQTYIDNKDYLKGLTVLRNASTLMPETQIGRDVNAYLAKSFRDVFTDDAMKTLSPLDAIRIHDEFKDMIPKGAEGDAYTEKLAERLVEADLLGRAAVLLDYQVANRLQGAKKADVAIRLAAIRLLDGNPDGAIRSLDVAQATLDKLKGAQAVPKPAKTDATAPEDVKPEAGEAAVPAKDAPTSAPADAAAATAAATVTGDQYDPEKQRQVYLLRARALSMKKMPTEAMAVLEGMEPDPDVNRLRADIAWTAGNWKEAADAFSELISAEDISSRRPLGDYQRDLVFNRAIALNLSNDRVALANLRDRYNGQMKETTKGAMFEIVTRPRRPDMVGSREAIDSMISEIDLFQGFLDGYAKMDAPPASVAPAKVETAPQPDTGKDAVAAQTDIDQTKASAPKDGVPETEQPKTQAPTEKIPGDMPKGGE